MRRAALPWVLPLLLAVAPVAARAQEDPVALLERRVQETSRKVTDAFVFFPGGSGVLISADGWILTNHHVIGSFLRSASLPETVDVNLADGRQFKGPDAARVVCSDPVGDIALLKVEGKDFPFVEFGDSRRARVGQYVLAIGNPFGQGNEPAADGRYYPSVSLGIVSAVHRYMETYGDCIQTDAAVNPGNSGGPLVDLDGRLLGINGRIQTRYENRVNSGVGFAIPTHQIRNFLPQMKAGGISRILYHGEVKGLILSDHHTNGTGALVRRVRENSPAGQAGFRAGDLITAVNGIRVINRQRYLGTVSTYPSETEITVTVLRDSRAVDLKVVLGLWGGPGEPVLPATPEPANEAWLGITFEDLSENGRVVGAVIKLVLSASPAEKADLVEGDVIVEVDGQPVRSHETLVNRIRLKKPGDTIRLGVRRDGRRMDVVVELERNPRID